MAETPQIAIISARIGGLAGTRIDRHAAREMAPAE
jgi:hypothetical protein